MTLGGAALLAFGTPLYHSWAERHAVSLAEAYLAQTNFAHAAVSARRALQLNSNSVAACRILATLCERNLTPETVYWRQRVVELEPTGVSNRLALALSALRLQLPELADQALQGVSSNDQVQAAYHQVAAQVAFSRHDLNASEQHLVRAACLDGTNAALRHNLQIVRLHSADTNTAGQARADLDRARMDATYGPAILRALIREAISRDETKRAYQLSSELQETTEVTFEDRLLHLAVLCGHGSPIPIASDRIGTALTNGTPRPGVKGALAEFIRRTQAAAGTEPGKICALAEWLCRNRLAEAAFPWLETLPVTVRRATCVRLVESQCRLLLHGATGLAGWLNARPWDEDDHLRHALLAFAHRQAGDEPLAILEWKRALHACQSDGRPVPRSQQALVRLAGTWAWEEEAEMLLWEIAAGPETHWALSLLQRAYELSGDTRSLLKVFQAEVGRDASNLVARNNLAATSLLLQTNLTSAHQLAREMYQARPTNAAVVCTYAYSLHLQGRTAEAGQLLSALPQDAKFFPGTATYYGIVLAAQGARAQASQYLARARTGHLLPEERALVDAAERSIR